MPGRESAVPRLFPNHSDEHHFVIPFVTGLKPGQHVVSPRAFALVLAGLGNLSLFLAAVQHRINLQALRARGLKVPWSAAAMAAFLSLLGILVLLMVLLRL